MDSQVTVVQNEQIEKFRQQSSEIITQAKALALAVKDEITLQAAVDYCLAIRKWRKDWKAYNEPERVQIQKLTETFRDRVRQIDEPMERAEDEILEPAINAFHAEQLRRHQAEEKRKLDEARKREEDRRLADAAKLESQGKKDEAAAVLASPQPIIPEAAPPPMKPVGGNFRQAWDFRIVDDSLIPREYLLVDTTKIRQIVNAMKAETRIAGVEVFPKSVLSSNPNKGA